MADELKSGDRLIVLRRTREAGEPSYLRRIYESAGRSPPPALNDWDDLIDEWCHEYRSAWPEATIVEVLSARCVYVFDRTLERLVVPYGLSVARAGPRDTNRIRRFPDVNIGVRATAGEHAFAADRGHFLGHAAGGELDINLFPHRRELNRGTSAAGRRFREMERYVASESDIFFYHRPLYDDETWIPSELEYGVLVEDAYWWVERFRNKPDRIGV